MLGNKVINAAIKLIGGSDNGTNSAVAAAAAAAAMCAALLQPVPVLFIIDHVADMPLGSRFSNAAVHFLNSQGNHLGPRVLRTQARTPYVIHSAPKTI